MERVKDAQTVRHDAAALALPAPLTAPPSATALAPPASPTSSLTAPAPRAVPPADAAAALDQLVASVVGARGAVLASIDGFPLAKSTSMPTEPAHAAMLAAVLGVARQLVVVGGGSNLRQVVVDHDGGLLLVWPIGSRRVLAVLADAGVDQRTLRHFVQANVRVLADRPVAIAAARPESPAP